MIIYYENVAIKWCKKQERQMEIGVFDETLNSKITKIFQWDLELNLIC